MPELPSAIARRAEKPNAVQKNQVEGEQDWSGQWISFRVIAQHCASPGTP
jgi:hypothetical protein